MVRLYIVVMLMCFFAYISKNSTTKTNVAYGLVVLIYALFVGLRKSYNDTWNYINSFNNSEPLMLFLQDSTKTKLTNNPLFYGIFAFTREITANYHIIFMLFAIFNSVCLIRFIQKNSYGNFAFSVFLFWGFGLGMFGAAAMKQITAMAVLTIAFNAMTKKKWIRFMCAVVIASLIHTYAIAFLVLPFFKSKPWNWKSILLLFGTFAIMATFTSTMSAILDYAEDTGKSVASYEVFDGHGMNILRVGVFSVVPLMLFVFRKRLVPQMDKNQYYLSNMCIISFLFVLLASVNGANMFGRMATYFLFGSICMAGWVIDNVFTGQTKKAIKILATVLFILFLFVDNQGIDSYGGYRAISLLEFITGVI